MNPINKPSQSLEALLNYSQSLVELTRVLPGQVELIKEIIFLSLKTQTKAQDATNMMRNFTTVAHQTPEPEDDSLVDMALAAEYCQPRFKEFVETTRSLAQVDFDDWQSYATTLGTIGDSEHFELSDTLTTIRLLAEIPDFQEWKSFFACIKTLQEQSPAVKSDVLATVRHFATSRDLNVWASLFTFLKNVQLQDKTALLSSTASARRILGYFKSTVSLEQIFKLMAQYPPSAHAFSFGQLDSKKWLIEEAKKALGNEWGTVYILAGWAGVAARFIFDAGIRVEKIRSFDIAPEVAPWAETLNRSEVMVDWKFKASIQDINRLQYPSHYSVRRSDGTFCELFDSPDLVINTSCEHMSDIDSWWAQIPKGTKVILQSNDGFHIPEHSRCFRTLDEFKSAMGLSRLLYAGATPLPEFNRFMLIGIK